MKKKCKLCEREIGDGDFYKGVPNVHKACHAKRAREYRLANLERYKEYDRLRANDPDRVSARAAYAASERGKAVGIAAKKRWMAKRPEARAAHVILGNAVRDGLVEKPMSCQRCKQIIPSRSLHAHHTDYTKPLDVEWVCAGCHRDEHKQSNIGDERHHV